MLLSEELFNHSFLILKAIRFLNGAKRLLNTASVNAFASQIVLHPPAAFRFHVGFHISSCISLIIYVPKGFHISNSLFNDRRRILSLPQLLFHLLSCIFPGLQQVHTAQLRPLGEYVLHNLLIDMRGQFSILCNTVFMKFAFV